MFRKLLVPCSCSSSKAKLDNPLIDDRPSYPSSHKGKLETTSEKQVNSVPLAGPSSGGQVTLNLRPMENSLILSKIFQHLPATDLCSCRVVSQLWRQGASKIMRKRPSISATVNGLDLSKFTKTIKDCQDNPYTMYDVNMLDVTESALPASRKEFTSLCKLVGGMMGGLILGLYDDDVPFFLPKLSKYTTNMNRMFLIILQSEASAAAAAAAATAEGGASASPASSPASMVKSKLSKNAIIKLPHLRKLGAAWKGNSSPMLDQAIEAIINGSIELKLLNLQEWKSCPTKILQNCTQKFEQLESLVLHQLGASQLRILEGNKNMSHLTEFEVDLKADVEEEIFFQILKLNSKTLQILRVSHEGKKSNFKFDTTTVSSFPQMTKLHTLQLHEWDGPIFVDSIVITCPKLEVLELKNFHPDNIIGSVKQNSSTIKNYLVLESLKFLVVKPDGNFPTRKMKMVLKKLVPLFPQLTDFCCVVETDDIFDLILTSINQKVEGILLDMSIEVSDASFTGIPIEILDDHFGNRDDEDDEQMELLPCGCWVFKNPDQFRTNPYIEQLQDLTNIQISIPPGTQIGSFSLHHGIADLKALKILRLDTKETKWCLRGIADNLPNLKNLELKTRRLYSDEDLQYVADKLPSLKIEFSNEPEYLYVVRRIPIVEEAG